jgi:glycosyltransferase involved in cell wall biosynthesis
MKQKILFIKHADSSFIATDQQILETRYRVVLFLTGPGSGGFWFLKRMISLCWFLLRNAHGASAFVAWFGDYHSAVMVFFGLLLHKKRVIFAGGQDAICYPELQKGVYCKKLRSCCVKFAFSHATHIIPNHASLIFHENFYYSSTGKKDGIRHYIPRIKTPMTVIPNGISTTAFFREPAIRKDPALVLTVGTMGSKADFLNKGFDLFTELARRNPGLKCIMTGVGKPFMSWIEENYRVQSIPNLEICLASPPQVLFEQYNRATVFVQASITEGMPNALGEAMLCECIPVGSAVNGIPDVIGKTGVIVGKRDVAELEKAVLAALTLNTGADARQHILNNFTFAIREKRLLALFHELIGSS